jgi:hypothetical protein
MEKDDQFLCLKKENSRRQKQTLKPKNNNNPVKNKIGSVKSKKIIHLNSQKPHSEFIFENSTIEFEKTSQTSKFFDLKKKYTNTKRTFLE